MLYLQQFEQENEELGTACPSVRRVAKHLQASYRGYIPGFPGTTEEV